METLPQAFAPLRAYKQFIVFKYVDRPEKPGKLDKIPVHHETLQHHNPLDPAIWLFADDAIRRVQELGNSSSGFGVGFTFTEEDPFFFLDIDNAWDNIGGWSATSRDLVAQFQGAAVEVSSSARGLHILGRGKIGDHRTRDIEKAGLELYHKGRFVALTGTHAQGNADHDCTAALDTLVRRYFPSEVKTASISEPASVGVGLTDEQIIEKALRSASAAGAFGSRITFSQLWNRDEEALCRFFPSDGSYNGSDADFALAIHLAFWTGKNAEQMERLMRMSGLYREKWEREGNFPYLPETIERACSIQTMTYTGAGGANQTREVTVAGSKPPITGQTTTLTASNLTGIVTPAQQLDVFRGCVYVVSEHKVFIPNGRLVDDSRFNVIYGGMAFVLDHQNATLEKKAFKALTQTQVNPRIMVETTCFKPNFPMGEILTINGESCVNVYKPPNVHRVKGDATPFLNHIKKLFPNDNDRFIMMNYLAACVQMVGHKFQWCPLIQGAQGNGKSILSFVVAYCVGRQYSHFPKVKSISSNFNAWLADMVFIGVEDLYSSREDMVETMEALKPMITGEYQGIEGKGINQRTQEVVANFILNSNHKDALILTKNDRRFATFYTPQQTLEDLKRDGMTGDYFPDLLEWMKQRDGYAICAELLFTYPIDPAFKKTLFNRAPITSSTEESHVISYGMLEQTIIDAIDEERMGFRGNFISSNYLNSLLKENGLSNRIRGYKLTECLSLLGYIKHPNLENDGKISKIILPDGVRPRIYVKKDSEESKLINEQIAEAYTKAQGS